MARGDGDGWVRCGLGHRHWGRFGAAGLLGYTQDESGMTLVLLQHRAWWSSHGGTWGLFGGARMRDEPPDAAALRETAEESTLPGDAVHVRGIFRDDHGRWAYDTVIGELPGPVPVEPAGGETVAAAWVPADEVPSCPLHPGLAALWPVLRDALQPVVIIVDAANVVGARADGWWRDRAGAAARLRDELGTLVTRGIAALPEGVPAPPLDRWFPEIVLVVEGAARAIVTGGDAARAPVRGGVRVVVARGSGDDAIAALAASERGIRLVVTADRELRRRCAETGAAVTGPRWLLGQL